MVFQNLVEKSTTTPSGPGLLSLARSLAVLSTLLRKLPCHDFPLVELGQDSLKKFFFTLALNSCIFFPKHIMFVKVGVELKHTLEISLGWVARVPCGF